MKPHLVRPALPALLVLAAAAAQDKAAAPLRYAFKENAKLYFTYEYTWKAPAASSRLMLWAEWKIGKPKGNQTELTITFVRIQSELSAAGQQESYDSSGAKDNNRGALIQTMQPGALHDLLDQPYTATIDTRGRLGSVKPPAKAKDKDVLALLGGNNSDLFLGLAVPELSATAVAVDAAWPQKVTLTLDKAGTQTFEFRTSLAARAADKSTLQQAVTTTDQAELKFQAADAKGSCDLDAGGAIVARQLLLPFRGPLDIGLGDRQNVDLTLTVSKTDAPPAKGKKARN